MWLLEVPSLVMQQVLRAACHENLVNVSDVRVLLVELRRLELVIPHALYQLGPLRTKIGIEQ